MSETRTFDYDSYTVTVTIRPDAGPPGTRVTVIGSGFVGQAATLAQSGGYRFDLDLLLPGGCELIGDGEDAQVSVDASGSLLGSFAAPSTGTCFQGNGAAKPLPSDHYHIILGAHPSFIGTFDLT